MPGAGRRSDGPGLTRRAFGRALGRAGLGFGVGFGLVGCTGLVRGTAAAPPVSRAPHPGPYRLRIAIFEIERIDLPYHAGLLIDAPQGRILYDPAGRWQSDACARTADVHHPMTDSTTEDWLARRGLMQTDLRWTLHLFETDVTQDVASQAYALALSRPPAASGTCAWSVAQLLSELPGFDDLIPRIVTARLLDQLRARPDLTYSIRRPVPPGLQSR
jgi:hypothetical protein